MSMEHWFIDTEDIKPKYWEKNVSQCNFLHHNFHTECHGIENESVRSEADYGLPGPRLGIYEFTEQTT